MRKSKTKSLDSNSNKAYHILTMTNGQIFTKSITKYMSIGSTSKRWTGPNHKDGMRDRFDDIIENIVIAATDPGYFVPDVAKALAIGFAPALSHQRHVVGCRINGTKIARIQSLTPYQFIKYLASMIDAGVENVGQAEDFYRKMAA